jgi:hypothetical protein
MRGEGGVAGSQPMSTVLPYTGAPINFGDLTPYLTYGFMSLQYPVLGLKGT